MAETTWLGPAGRGGRLLAGIVGIALWLAATAAAAAPVLSAKERSSLARALAAAEGGSWQYARRLAREVEDPLASTILRLLELLRSSERFPFAVYRDFMDAHPTWPGMSTLQVRAEEALDERVAPAEVRAFFAAREPRTRPGRVRLAQALLNVGEQARAGALLRQAWIEGDFGSAEEASFLARYGRQLSAEDHVARLDRLLWDGQTRAAERMLQRVDAGPRALAQARIRLQRRQSGVDAAINRVPQALRSDPGLVFDRIRWRREAGRDDGAVELLLEARTAAMRPELWWAERHRQARRLMREGRHTLAYRLASQHGLSDGLPFAEAEWLSGWLALRFLDRPDEALAHFSRLWDGVGTPISLARAGYWAGRAAAAKGDEDLARAWYRKAAEHRIAYYGQLAEDELLARGLQPPPPTADPPPPSAADKADFERREPVRAVRMLAEVGAVDVMRLFLMRLTADARGVPDVLLVTDLAAESGHPELMVRSARLAATNGHLLEEAAFPVPGIHGLLYPVGGAPDPALLLAVARQESLFDSSAVSRAGARGVLQLMPATARSVARTLGLAYSESRLTSDPEYNARLGAHYLHKQLERYGDPVLALAAYNAGPGRISAWLGQLGDPRALDAHGRIDWMESIPFSETRNYVQRVLEAERVYRRQLNGSPRVVRVGGLAGPAIPPPAPAPKPDGGPS